MVQHQVRSGRVLVCDQIILELVRLAANETRSRELAGRLSAFDAVPMPQDVWSSARDVRLAMAAAETIAVFRPRISSSLRPRNEPACLSSTTTGTTSASRR